MGHTGAMADPVASDDERTAAVDADDPFAPEVLADPFVGYAHGRSRCAVRWARSFDPPFAVLLDHADVRAALGDDATWSIRYGQSPQYQRGAALVSDPPEHTAFRRLFNRSFTPRTVEALVPRIEQLADDFLDVMTAGGASSGDLATELARPLPTIVIAELLGVPVADRERFTLMADALTATYNESDPRASAGPRQAFDDYFREIVAQRRAALVAAGVGEPCAEHVGTVLPQDLVSSFVVATIDGRPLTDSELGWLLLLLLLGGNETSAALITNLVWRLLEDRSRWEAVLADRSLVDAAVEESLRHDPPVLGLFRTPTCDVELHGERIAERTKTMLCFGAANHDPAVHDDPDTFRLDRDLDAVRGASLTFGFGTHYCPGASLARMEGRVVLGRILDRLPGLRLDGPTERIDAFNLWGRASLPVAW